MISSVWTAVALGVALVGLFVYKTYKQEEELEQVQRQITANQEKFTNK